MLEPPTRRNSRRNSLLSVTIFAVSCSTLSSLFSTVTSETNHHRRRHCNSLCRRSICINTRVAYPVETALNVAWCFSVHSLRAGYIVAIISVERILFSRCILHSVADKNVRVYTLLAKIRWIRHESQLSVQSLFST